MDKKKSKSILEIKWETSERLYDEADGDIKKYGELQRKRMAELVKIYGFKVLTREESEALRNRNKIKKNPDT